MHHTAACVAGTFYNATENTCQPCPEDTYQDEDSQDFCKPCKANEVSDKGSDNQSDCKCEFVYSIQ